MPSEFKTQRRLFSIAASPRTAPATIDLHGWGLKAKRFRVKTLILPPVANPDYRETDLALLSISGASGHSVLNPHLFRDYDFGWCKKYTIAVPVCKGVPTIYTALDWGWDVVEAESFNIESLVVSVALPNGTEIDFGADSGFIMLEVECA